MKQINQQQGRDMRQESHPTLKGSLFKCLTLILDSVWVEARFTDFKGSSLTFAHFTVEY